MTLNDHHIMQVAAMLTELDELRANLVSMNQTLETTPAPIRNAGGRQVSFMLTELARKMTEARQTSAILERDLRHTRISAPEP